MSETCIGYGEREGICTNPAGTPWTPLWCDQCDAERRAHISAQFEKIAAKLDPPALLDPPPDPR